MISLPIDEVLPEVLAGLRTGSVVLQAPPGAGKTTRVPPALLDSGLLGPGQVVMLEPRRVAARAAARRIAEERGVSVGEEVGYQVRFDKRAGPRTRILVVTEGIFLRMLQADPFLERVSCVVFDEFHERRMDSDLALALTRLVRDEARDDLKLVVMSATLDPGPVARWLGDAAIVHSQGRAYPVAIEHLAHEDPRPMEDQVADHVRRLIVEGDVLAFLPGVREIHRTAERLAGLDAQVVPLYGALSPARQDAALRPGRGARVVLATNVAETSVTVPGVTAVVDSGLAKSPHHDPRTGLSRLEVVHISRASADQRAGRAGRLGPGRCQRLWTLRQHRAMEAYQLPEVVRSELAGACLQLIAWGQDPSTLPWLDAPPAPALEAACSLLEDLGATHHGKLTPIGQALSSLPVHPRLGRLLLEGHRLGITKEVSLAAALLSERHPFRGRQDTRSGSDLLDQVVWAQGARGPEVRSLRRVADQLTQALRRLPGGPRGEVPHALGRAVLSAWPDRVVRRRRPGSDRGRMVGGKGVVLDRTSAVREAELFVALHAEAGAEARVRMASEVQRDWLEVVEEEVLDFDVREHKVRAHRVSRYRDLVLRRHPCAPDPIEASERLEAEACARPPEVLPVGEGWRQLQARLAALHRWQPRSWPPPDLALWRALIPSLCLGNRSFGQLRAADWPGALRDHLGWSRWQELQRLAPERLTVPSGQRIRLDWTGAQPVLAVRIQELFGLDRTPTVCGGQRPVLLHLLAPNYRPQQITDDLSGFWDRAYPEIRKELRARYPKHPWPEDPRRAKAVCKGGRRG